jgi:dUTP pyrophosphatase
MTDSVTFGVFLGHQDAKLPTKAHESDAGYDLYSVEDVELQPGDRKIVDTGIHLEMENGWEAQIRPRSGNAAKLGLSIVNSPGTIDASYTGLIKVILLNTSKEVVNLPKGSKVAQMVFKRVPTVYLTQICYMPSNDTRGSKGFGSSGQ